MISYLPYQVKFWVFGSGLEVNKTPFLEYSRYCVK